MPWNVGAAKAQARGSDNTQAQPGIYRPPRTTPPRKRPKPTVETPIRASVQNSQKHRLEIRVQALFDRYGACQLRLLAERVSGSDKEIVAKDGYYDVTLTAYGDDWYQVQLEKDLGAALSEGVMLSARSANGERLAWQLSRRDVYVLAGQHGFAGYVPAVRLKTGRSDQIVLCAAERQREVAAILEQAGCGNLYANGLDFGAPTGWIFFRPVQPKHVLPQVEQDAILNILRPLPDIEISLDGGICIQHSKWLAGFPPRISISGELPSHERATIDEQPAVCGGDGSYTAPGWDNDGHHTVWCAGKQTSYSIETPNPNWQRWEPYRYPKGSVCGATSAPNGGKVITVPATNPVIIGALPEQVFRCTPRASREWTGHVPFDPVWALPDNSKKNDRYALLIKSAPAIAFVKTTQLSKKKIYAIKKWCRSILGSSPARFLAQSSGESAEQLWNDYRSIARRTWRSMRQHGRK